MINIFFSLSIYVMQRIDFDPDAEPIQRFVAAKVAKVEAAKAKKRNEDEQKVRNF